MTFKIAFRNLIRNRRRSGLTILAIALGGAAIVLFGEYAGYIRAGLETSAVRSVGHFTLFSEGYSDYGAGNPAAFAIQDYPSIVRAVQSNPELKQDVRVITPIISLTGIAGNFDVDASKTFLGTGFVPSDRDLMRTWDGYGVRRSRPGATSGLRDDDESRGVVGVGLARVLGLCEPLHLPQCPPKPERGASPEIAGAIPSDLELLAERERPTVGSGTGLPRLDLLAATSGGAPNVVSLSVDRAEPQGARELDDSYVAMHFKLAQRLLFGVDSRSAGGIILQLHRTEAMPRVRAALLALFQKQGLRLELRDFAELQPFYKQTTGLFSAIFAFISAIMVLIVLFTVVNTVGMSVMERTTEIGTTRALGVRRGGVRRLFLAEGLLLGAIGATLGVGGAQLAAILFNHGGFTWTPPGQSSPVPLAVMTSGVAGLLAKTWLASVVVATLAAVVPASRAARLKIVDALRHV